MTWAWLSALTVSTWTCWPFIVAVALRQYHGLTLPDQACTASGLYAAAVT